MHFPSPAELRALYPLPPEGHAFVQEARAQIHNLIHGKDLRRALVLGPCSIHNLPEALEYARRVQTLQLQVASHYLLVMRAYVEKPRTVIGWKGFLYDPHLDGSNDIVLGLQRTRELFLALTQMRIPIATEFLDPLTAPYFSDLVSWGFIGARTSSSPSHRQLASSLPLPIGFKNSLEGGLEPAIFGMIAARNPHTFLQIGLGGKVGATTSPGNRATHLVLRGSQTGPNYDEETFKKAFHQLSRHHLPTRLLVDCAHGNCEKEALKQREVFHTVSQRNTRTLLGLMVESNLFGGSQMLALDPSALKTGVSITDPCLDWDSTEELVLSSLINLTHS